MKLTSTTLTCRCGQVAFELKGRPILAVVCHCDDCQRASRELEALPGALPILDSAKGTAYVMHHRTGAACLRGSEQLVDHVIENEPFTKRVVASCCQTPLYLDFAKGHWQSWFWSRWPEPTPRLRMRNQTRFVPAGTIFPDGLPQNRTYSFGFITRLLVSFLTRPAP